MTIPIDFGARISGKLDKNWRVGLLNMQTRKDQFHPGYNFGMFAIQRKLFSRSNFTLFAINKQASGFEDLSTDLKNTNNKFNRNLGIEYNLASANNRWTGKFMYAKSFDTKQSNESWSHVGNLAYANKYFILSWQQEYVSKNYSAEVGYVQRKNYYKISPTISYLFYPKGGKLLTHGPSLGFFNYFTPQFKSTDRSLILNYVFSFRTQARADLWVADDWVQLLQPFDPTNSDKPKLAAGTKHHWNSFGGDFISAPQKLFTYLMTFRQGGYYQHGYRTYISSEFGYRFQPYVKLALASSYNKIDLEAPWNKTRFWLVGPRVDVTFTNSLYFTSFIQYNEQIKNLNINTRLQWRFKPASDIFLVYTDNYFVNPDTFFSTPWSVKNRAIVFKMNYWWNL
jgi:hypothetical protein